MIMNKGRIYFIKPVGAVGPIKIGFAIDVEERLSFLSRWSPVALELIGSIAGSRSDESRIHASFADLHSHGEWFIADPRLVSALPEILADGMQFVRDQLPVVGCLPWMARSAEARAKISASMKHAWSRHRTPGATL